MSSRRHLPLLVAALASACATAGSSWMAQPLPNETWTGDEGSLAPTPDNSSAPPPAGRPASRIIGAGTRIEEPSATQAEGSTATQKLALEGGGRSLGTFRNTYYDFPSEADFDGAKVPLKSARCETIAEVPRGFFESVCVQGSGRLRSGMTVSFSKRDCNCAEVCPRTNQKICFDALDPAAYPWGRGATGKPITPLLTVAVDSDVIPLGTALYVPELDGVPRDTAGTPHEGCFVAQDRGVRVKGKHVDFFTGHASLTALWNRLVPSNKGVTVVLESPRCARAGAPQK
ncbi:MAG: 3D domain-containing protein [Myxococcota bacterium]